MGYRVLQKILELCPNVGKRRLRIVATFGETFKMGQVESAYYSVFGLEMLSFQDPSPEYGQSY